MRTDDATVIRLEDYRPTDWLIDTVDLSVSLHPMATKVVAQLAVRPNPAGVPDAPLVLDGDELTLVSIAIDGRLLASGRLQRDAPGLTIPHPPAGPFLLSIETLLNPSANTKLMGLYRSSGVYCTQCEAEGFRRITYFLDRPDVMAVYTTRIEADEAEAPVLLGNGNPVERGELAGRAAFRRLARSASQALLPFRARRRAISARSPTHSRPASGRKVELGIYVEHGKEDRAGYAMDALIRSMRWDEKAFGCEYDLDVFNIVAVSDFNMGAMENKGLNVFNDKYVLASSRDRDRRRLRAYRGDHRARIFPQLDGQPHHLPRLVPALPEGRADRLPRPGIHLRPALASGEAHRRRPQSEGAAVRRGSGPLAHPVRPSAYREINNFYTATVYEKGSELIRCSRSLIGADAFRAGMDLYLKRCDGTAATIEDFLACFAETSGRDLDAFLAVVPPGWHARRCSPRAATTPRHRPTRSTSPRRRRRRRARTARLRL